MRRYWITKYFHFSASHQYRDKVFGHNYVLGITLGSLNEADEEKLIKNIHTHLIDKVHSRDLGMGVDFLKGKEINDRTLLESFAKIIEGVIPVSTLKSLTLKRDERTLAALVFSSEFGEISHGP